MDARMKKGGRAVLWAALLSLLLLWAGVVPAASADAVYTENEWDFVDGSMDISGGIPKDADGVLEQIQRNGVLRVATELGNPPYAYTVAGKSGQDQYAGADVELARRIAERMGVELQIIPMTYVQVLPAVAENQCDLTISTVGYTPAKASAYTLSKGYYFPAGGSKAGLVVREENRGLITSLDDLRDKTLVVRSGSLQEAVVANRVTAYREFRRVASIQTVYEAVAQGKADVGVVDEESAKAYLSANPDSGLTLAEGFSIPPDEHFLGYRVAARKGELQLAYFVNGVIDEVLIGGEYEQWLKDAQ